MQTTLAKTEAEINAPGDISLISTKFLLKSVEISDDAEEWKFESIASDESEDVEGDTILRKSIDLSYANNRGYVNWDHSEAPEDQIGFLTKAEIIDKANIGDLEKSMGVTLKNTASVYVEGKLYKHVDRAIAVHKIMKSLKGSPEGLGLSLDGKVARNIKTGGIVKAFVRGVAFSHKPVHTKTLVQLKKSLESYEVESLVSLKDEILRDEGFIQQLTKAIKAGATAESKLSFDEATLFVLKQRPAWTYDLASKLVKFVIQGKT